MAATSIKNSLTVKVVSSILNFCVAVTVGILVPRAVGPKDFGELMYVIATVDFLLLLGAAQSHPAYIYFQSNGEFSPRRINGTYFTVLGGVAVCVLLLVTFTAQLSFFQDILWNGVSTKEILYMGAGISVMTFWQNKLLAYADCHRLTLSSETARFVSRLFLLVAIVALFLIQKLSTINYSVLWIVSLVLFFVFYFRYVEFEFVSFSWRRSLTILRQMWRYLKPLMAFSMIAALYSYAGKYLLQQQAGSVEQGYYNFAFSFAMIPVTFLASIMTIYMSEMTKLFTSGQPELVRELFLRNLLKVFALHALITFFLCAFAPEVVLQLSGAKFLGAVPALRALTIFSLLHTFGILSGNLYLSSGRNKSYSMINCIFMISGLIVFALVYAHGHFNATNLAIMMAVFYGLRVSVQLYFNAIQLDFSFSLLVVKILGLVFLIGGGAWLLREFNLNLILSAFIYVVTFIVSSVIANDVYGVLKVFLYLKKLVG
ncbi:MAG: oligosaccharide flippase family protein [Desulfuromusa sp.]|nr:oligosaccharide flippase family protein [Desulfuromusa sp.]